MGIKFKKGYQNKIKYKMNRRSPELTSNPINGLFTMVTPPRVVLSSIISTICCLELSKQKKMVKKLLFGTLRKGNSKKERECVIMDVYPPCDTAQFKFTTILEKVRLFCRAQGADDLRQAEP